jgi:hypothetical protein
MRRKPMLRDHLCRTLRKPRVSWREMLRKPISRDYGLRVLWFTRSIRRSRLLWWKELSRRERFAGAFGFGMGPQPR